MIPKIKLPYFPVKIPSTGKIITIKPFTVEIEKFLLGLDDNKDLKIQYTAMENVLKFCINEEINLSDLCPGDIQYIYLQCYKISINDKIKFTFTCPNSTVENKCESIIIDIPIDKIEMSNQYKNDRILIDTEEGEYYLELKHITIKDAFIENDNILLLSKYIYRMYDKDGNNEQILSEEDKCELIKNLNMKQLEKLSEFINLMPRPSYTIKLECPTCHHIFEETIYDFFI